MIGRMDEGMGHLILLSVPLFVFLGLLIEMTGMAAPWWALGGPARPCARRPPLRPRRSHVPGLRHLGLESRRHGRGRAVLFPEMKQRGAKPGDLVALLAATGAQTETIPPSLVLITIGSVTGVSIAALFTGGLLPGIVLAITLCAPSCGGATAPRTVATSSARAGARSAGRF